jgi:glycosyltransferase involved in cell wall biosynthesis
MIETLRSLGVTSESGDMTVGFGLYQFGQAEPSAPTRAKAAEPLVSCLMVTRGNLEILPYSLECYANQTWARRELIVVTGADQADGVRALLAEKGLKAASVTGVTDPLPLGDLRNMATARARGEILLQWDDDDLSDPLRIVTAVAALSQTNAEVAFLNRWLIWWPARNLAAISDRRTCEGTIAIRRDNAKIYPALPRGEDTALIEGLNELVTLIDAPLQYVYTITGENTWDTGHFEKQVKRAEHLFVGDDYRAIFELLARRMPLVEYEAALRRTWTRKGSN